MKASVTLINSDCAKIEMTTNAWNQVVNHARKCPMVLDNVNLKNNADLPGNIKLAFFMYSLFSMSHLMLALNH